MSPLNIAMENYTARFITAEEIHYIKEIFKVDNTAQRQEMSPEQINRFLLQTQKGLEMGKAICSTTFDGGGKPIGMYVAWKMPMNAGWQMGLTKMVEKHAHYSTSADVLVLGLDLILEAMEAEGFYKFWINSSEKHLNIRNNLMFKKSKLFARYKWFDENIIPAGQDSSVEMFNFFRSKVNWTDIVVRMYVLDQPYRIEHLKKHNSKDYIGVEQR